MRGVCLFGVEDREAEVTRGLRWKASEVLGLGSNLAGRSTGSRCSVFGDGVRLASPRPGAGESPRGARWAAGSRQAAAGKSVTYRGGVLGYEGFRKERFPAYPLIPPFPSSSKTTCDPLFLPLEA